MKRLIALYIGLSMIFPSRGQEKVYIQPPSLAVHFVVDDFHSVRVQAGSGQAPSPPGTLHEIKAGLAASYFRGIGSRFECSGMIVGSILRFPFRKGVADDRELLLLEADAGLRYTFISGRNWLVPYWQTGLGISFYDNRTAFFLPFGPGIRINLTDLTFLQLDAQYRVPLTDNQTGHFLAGLGWGRIITKKKKQVWRRQAAVLRPPIPITSPVKTADTDGDGVPDSLDACPLVAGLAQYDGCPDSDGDGIPDNKDRCPLQAGLAKYGGCPLPDTAGVRRLPAPERGTATPAPGPGRGIVWRMTCRPLPAGYFSQRENTNCCPPPFRPWTGCPCS